LKSSFKSGNFLAAYGNIYGQGGKVLHQVKGQIAKVKNKKYYHQFLYKGFQGVFLASKKLLVARRLLDIQSMKYETKVQNTCLP